jgi:hypothetical protein
MVTVPFDVGLNENDLDYISGKISEGINLIDENC